MNSVKKWYRFGIIAAAAVCFIMIPRLADAAERAQVIVGAEESIVSDTVVDPSMKAPAEGQVTPERPFTDRQMRPAGSAVVNESVMNGEPSLDVVNYASTVSKRTADELVLNTVISKMEDDATLSRLANKVYRENNGQAYDNVTIFWHIGDNPQPSAPWARTDIGKNSAVYEIVRITE